jgi:hypothetical protein
MTITTNDFLTRLQNGETAEEIAASLSAMLNEANEQYEAEKAQAQQNAVIEAAAINLIDALADYFVAIGIEEAIEDDEYNEMMDLLVEKGPELVAALHALTSYVETHEAWQKATCSDDAISTFLKKNGLL